LTVSVVDGVLAGRVMPVVCWPVGEPAVARSGVNLAGV
jgi:hypothetical protein